MGDSDDDDIRDILARAAWFFKDPELKSQAQGKLGYEDIWEFGAEAAGAYRSMERRARLLRTWPAGTAETTI